MARWPEAIGNGSTEKWSASSESTVRVRISKICFHLVSNPQPTFRAEFLRECGLKPMGPVGRLESAMHMARERALDGAIPDINLNGRPSFPICAILSARRIPFMSSPATRRRQFQLNTGGHL